MRISALLLALTGFALLSTAATNAAWIPHARRLTGESLAVRARAIRALRETPGLEADLKSALETPDRFLAFDVIVALDLKAFVPVLLEYSERDPTGYSYHTLNAIAVGEDARRVLAAYRERIRERKLSAVGKMAILDSIARTSVGIAPRERDRLAKDEFPEVRDSLLGYLRHSVLKLGRTEDIEPVAKLARDPDGALRMRAYSILIEIPPSLRKAAEDPAREAASDCDSEPLAEVKALCVRVAKEYSR